MKSKKTITPAADERPAVDAALVVRQMVAIEGEVLDLIFQAMAVTDLAARQLSEEGDHDDVVHVLKAIKAILQRAEHFSCEHGNTLTDPPTGYLPAELVREASPPDLWESLGVDYQRERAA